VIAHESGRALVPCDNTPAHWSFCLALRGNSPSPDQIAKDLEEDQIPVAMAFHKQERATAKYRGTRNRSENLNALGWKLAHIARVALRGRGPLESRPLASLEDHFVRFMSPRNMFVVPLPWAGLAETEEMTAAIKSWLDRDVV